MTPQIHLLTGLNGAGKTTLARRLERDVPAVRFSLDEWTLHLHGLAYDDPRYPAVAARCRDLIWNIAAQSLRAGSSVVLDWNLWNRLLRAEAAQRAAELGFECRLHHVRVPLDVAIRRATSRQDPRAHQLDADAVRHLAAIFEPPDRSESGFTLTESS